LNWHSCELILDSIDRMDLSIPIKTRNTRILKYVSLNKESLDIIKEGLHKGSIAGDKLYENKRLIEAQLKLIEED
jgi:hypothetical protein